MDTKYCYPLLLYSHEGKIERLESITSLEMVPNFLLLTTVECVLMANIGNKCSDFFKGVVPTNLYRDSKALENLVTYMDILMKFNIICRCPVINRDGHLMIIDAQIQNLL